MIIYSEFNPLLSKLKSPEALDNFLSGICADGPLVVIAEIGRWDGVHKGYRVLGKDNDFHIGPYIKEVFEDTNSLYIDKHNLRGVSAHHDGTNHYLFRSLKLNVTINTFEEAYAREIKKKGEISSAFLSRYTESLLFTADMFKDYSYSKLVAMNTINKANYKSLLLAIETVDDDELYFRGAKKSVPITSVIDDIVAGHIYVTNLSKIRNWSGFKDTR